MEKSRTEKNRELYQKMLANQSDKKDAMCICVSLIVCVFMTLCEFGNGSEIAVNIALIAIAGIIIGFGIYGVHVDKRDNLPKSLLGESYVKEYQKKKMQIECSYGLPQPGDAEYEACQKALKALKEEYNG